MHDLPPRGSPPYLHRRAKSAQREPSCEDFLYRIKSGRPAGRPWRAVLGQPADVHGGCRSWVVLTGEHRHLDVAGRARQSWRRGLVKKDDSAIAHPFPVLPMKLRPGVLGMPVRIHRHVEACGRSLSRATIPLSALEAGTGPRPPALRPTVFVLSIILMRAKLLDEWCRAKLTEELFDRPVAQSPRKAKQDLQLRAMVRSQGLTKSVRRGVSQVAAKPIHGSLWDGCNPLVHSMSKNFCGARPRSAVIRFFCDCHGLCTLASSISVIQATRTNSARYSEHDAGHQRAAGTAEIAVTLAAPNAKAFVWKRGP